VPLTDPSVPHIVGVQARPVLKSTVKLAITVSGAVSLFTEIAIFIAVPPAKIGKGTFSADKCRTRGDVKRIAAGAGEYR